MFFFKPASEVAHHAIEDGDDFVSSQRDMASVTGDVWGSTRLKPPKRGTSQQTDTTAASSNSLSPERRTPVKKDNCSKRRSPWRRLRKKPIYRDQSHPNDSITGVSDSGETEIESKLSQSLFEETSIVTTSGGFASEPVRQNDGDVGVLKQMESIRSHRLDIATNQPLLHRQNAEVVGRESAAASEWDISTSFSVTEDDNGCKSSDVPPLGPPATSIRVLDLCDRRGSAMRQRASSQMTLLGMADLSKRGGAWGHISGLTAAHWSDFESQRSVGSGIEASGMYLQTPLALLGTDDSCSGSEDDASGCLLYTRANSRDERFLSMATRDPPQQFASNRNVALLSLQRTQKDSMYSAAFSEGSCRLLRRHSDSTFGGNQNEISLPALEEDRGRRPRTSTLSRSHSDSDLDKGHWVYMMRAPTPPTTLRESYLSDTMDMSLLVSQPRRRSDTTGSDPSGTTTFVSSFSGLDSLIPPSSQCRSRADSDVLKRSRTSTAAAAEPPPSPRTPRFERSTLMHRRPSISASVKSLSPPGCRISKDLPSPEAVSAAKLFATAGLMVSSMSSAPPPPIPSLTEPSRSPLPHTKKDDIKNDRERCHHTSVREDFNAISSIHSQAAGCVFWDDPEDNDEFDGVGQFMYT